jgi:predicted DNA binding CopG/RHH family protein
MKPLDLFERNITADHDAAGLVSLAPITERLSRFKAAASAIFLKVKRINIRLSSPDLMDIQEKAMERGIPIKCLSPACCISVRLGAW